MPPGGFQSGARAIRGASPESVRLRVSCPLGSALMKTPLAKPLFSTKLHGKGKGLSGIAPPSPPLAPGKKRLFAGGSFMRATPNARPGARG